ncbi:hypothetical protein KC356_g29 [Hortaea werneckii]|nr:hypothetical protein KC356_g29 [Hortaea werneckii]
MQSRGSAIQYTTALLKKPIHGRVVSLNGTPLRIIRNIWAAAVRHVAPRKPASIPLATRNKTFILPCLEVLPHGVWVRPAHHRHHEISPPTIEGTVMMITSLGCCPTSRNEKLIAANNAAHSGMHTTSTGTTPMRLSAPLTG